MQHVTYGAPLGPEDRERLRALIARVGETRALAVLRVSRQTLARALAGLGVQRGTALLLAEGLRTQAAERTP